jgi:hypothetical protein
VGNLAPTLLGFLLAKAAGVESSDDALADLLSAGVCFCYIASATCFAISSLTGPPRASLSQQQTELIASSKAKTQ